MHDSQWRHLPDRARVLQRLRSTCCRFPHAEELDEGGVGDPVYKVNGRIFAMQHLIDERMSLWCKAAPGIQEALVASNPGRFFVPPYVGHRGWVGIWLDVSLDWDEIGDLIEQSYRRTAPARLIPMLTDSGAATSGSTERMRSFDACLVVPSACSGDHLGHSV